MTTKFYAHKLVRSATTFDAAIESLVREGIAKSRGHAIFLARKIDGAAYDAWMQRRPYCSRAGR